MSKKIVFIIAGVIVLILVGFFVFGPSKKQLPESTIPTTTKYISDAKSVKLDKIPEGAEIVYHTQTRPEPYTHIFVMNRDGSNSAQITFEDRRTHGHIAVSHDKRYIAAEEFRASPEGGGRSILWLFDLEKGIEAQLVPEFHSAAGGGVDWSPDGFIYFAGQEKESSDIGSFEVYRIKLDGTGLKNLTSTSERAEADVSVSEDGTLVVYATSANVGAIRVMNSDGSKVRDVSNRGADPEISPDNKKVVFSSPNEEVPPNWPNIPGLNTAHDLWMANLDGTEFTRLTKPGPISIIPDWKDNSVVFTEISEKDNYQGAAIINTNGSGYKKIKPGAQAVRWIPSK